jgi:HEAT repeat protein
MKRCVILFLGTLLVATAASAGPREDIAEEAWVVVEKGTRSGDMTARARAAETLGKIPGKDVAPYLKEALLDPQWPVRRGAIKALVMKGDPQGKARIIEALKDPGVPIEDDVLDLLSVLAPAEGLSLLIDAVTKADNPNRDKLIKAVIAKGPEVAAPVLSAGLAKGDPLFAQHLADVRVPDRAALAALLAKDKNGAVVTAALAWAIEAAIPVPAATLKPLLKAKDDAQRYAAAELLARQGDATAVPVLLPLADRDAASQLRFLKAAAAAPSADVLPRLKKYLAPETPEDLLSWVYLAFAGSTDTDLRKRIEDDLASTLAPRRAAATRAYGRLLGNRALPKLHVLLGDGNPTVRKLAAEALGELAQVESVEHLERAVRDSNRDARFAVVAALSKIRDKSVVPVASYLVYDRDADIRKLAILAVCNANHDSAMPVLRISLEDRDPTVRGPVLMAIARLDMKQALDSFAAALPGLSPETLTALAETFKAEAVPFLRKAADSDRAWARMAALKTAMLLPDQEVAFLKDVAANSPFGDARQAALARLVVRSCPEALAAAGARLMDTVPEVRIAAIQTLATCGADDSLAQVRSALLDPEETVRVAAATSMLSYPKKASKAAPAGPAKAKAKARK